MPGNSGAAASAQGTADAEQLIEIHGGLGRLLQQDQTTELRIPEAQLSPNFHATCGGYFQDHLDEMAIAAAKYSGRAVAVRFMPNPIEPALLARADNRVVERIKYATADANILRRWWLMLDFDPVYPASGISATDEEHQRTLVRAQDCRQWLHDVHSWTAQPVLISTGNGHVTLYRINLPNDEASTRLVQGVLLALSDRFSDAQVKLDPETYHAAQLLKVPGTAACKGSSTADRPHRLVTLLEAPETDTVVTREQLEAIAEAGSTTRGRTSPGGYDTERLEALRGVLNRVGIEIRKEEPFKDKNGGADGRKLALRLCPFCGKADKASIFLFPDHCGFKCFQKPECEDKTWNDLCQLYPELAEIDQARSTTSTENADWQDPQPLGGELPAVPPFDEKTLPTALRALATNTSKRMQVPLDFPAIASVLCLAGVVGRRARIQPKVADHLWTVVPNLWGAIVAEPGMMKSPVLRAIAEPLYQIQKSWREDYTARQREFELEKEKAELEMAAWKQQYVKAVKDPTQGLPTRPTSELQEPAEKWLLVHDASPEKLHEILCGNPAGVLMERDELSGWLARMGEEGHGGERQFYLMLWNGDTTYSIARIVRGSLCGECCLSILGGIQPARLRNYLVDAVQDGPQNDGLFQRFQLLIYPDMPEGWTYVDEVPPAKALTEAAQLYYRLVALDPAQPRQYHFSPFAQKLFIDWLTELEHKLRRRGMHPALKSHLSKYRGLMPSLAVLFEMSDAKSGDGLLVSMDHAQQSAAFCDYLEAHARRIYSMIISPQRAAAAELGQHLTDGWMHAEGKFSVRSVYRNDWRGLGTPEEVRAALEILQDADWVRPQESAGKRTGRPPEVYLINPRLSVRCANEK
jgi:putative DNA primase/helicase